MTTPNLCQFWDCDEIIPWDHFLCYDHYTGYLGDMIDQCPACGQYKDAEYDVCLVCYRQPDAALRGFASPTARIAEPEARYYQTDAAPPVNANYAALLGELHDLRQSMARTDGLREFMVFSNDTLEQLAMMRPTTERAMLEISGIGPAKVARYGADVLRVIRRHTNRSQTPARENRRPAAAATTVERDNREFAGDKDADRFFVYILMQNDREYYIGQTRDLHRRLHQHRFNMSDHTAGKEPKLQWFTTVSTRPEAADLEQYLKQLNSHPASRSEITRWVAEFKKLTEELDYKPYQSTPQPVEREWAPFGGFTPPSSRGGQWQGGSVYQDDMADVDDLPF